MELFFIILICVLICAGYAIYRYPIGRLPIGRDALIKISTRGLSNATYSFTVPLSRDEFLQELSTPSTRDVLQYELDEEGETITFARHHFDKIRYNISVTDCEGGCRVMLYDGYLIFGRTVAPLFIDEFFAKRFGADTICTENMVDTVG